MRIRTLQLALAAFIALVLWYGYSFIHNAYTVAASRGVTWLLSYEGVYENPGVYWALREMSSSQCKHEAFRQVIQKRFDAQNPSPVFSAYATYFNREKPAVTIDVSALHVYDRWLISALRCHEGGIAADTESEIFSEGKTGYDLTHQFLAVRYGKLAKCAFTRPLQVVEKIEQSLAYNMYLEDLETQHAFSDISAERAALLLWGGYTDFVDETWIKSIATHQNVDGGWPITPGEISDTHSTSLSVWALAQWTNRCPFEDAHESL